MINEKGHRSSLKPHFDRWLTETEFVDTLIIRCAYLSIDCSDLEVANVPYAIERFLDVAQTQFTLQQLTADLGEAATYTVAIAANYFRICSCGRVFTWVAHDCAVQLLPRPWTHNNRCTLCLAEVIGIQAQDDHFRNHTNNCKLLAGRTNLRLLNLPTVPGPDFYLAKRNATKPGHSDWVLYGHSIQFIVMIREQWMLENNRIPPDLFISKSTVNKRRILSKILD